MSKKLCKVMPPVVERFLFGTRVYSENEVIEMLTELKLEIEEIEVTKENTEIRVGECCMKGACIDLIQQKINSLRGNKDVEI